VVYWLPVVIAALVCAPSASLAADAVARPGVEPRVGAVGETLSQALASAYWNNPDINAARAGTRAADEGVPLARSLRRPNVGAFGSLTGQVIDVSPGPTERRADAALGLSVTQPLFQGFRDRNAILEAEAAVLGSRSNLATIVQNVLLEAAEAYMDVLRDEAILDLRRRNVAFLQEELEAAEARFEVGEITRTDVAQTRARLASAQAEAARAEANLRASRAAFRRVIGHEPGRLSPGFVFGHLLPRSLAAALEVGEASHPSILAARHFAEAAAFEVKQIEGELLPTVTLEGQTDVNFGLDRGERTARAQITGRVTVPIYQGGAVAARTRRAKEVLGQRRLEVDVARDLVRSLIVSSWHVLEASAEAIAAATVAVEAAQIALEGVQEEFQVGLRTLLDVLDAQQELLDARLNLVIAQRDRVVASFGLLSAVGYLDAERLNLPVATYRPEEHYHAVRDKWRGLRTPDGR
jgi:outer membrane protein